MAKSDKLQSHAKDDSVATADMASNKSVQTCKNCKFQSAELEVYEEHVKNCKKLTESAKKTRFTCNVCNSSFARKAYLKKHQKAKGHDDEEDTSSTKSTGDKMNLTFPLASSGMIFFPPTHVSFTPRFSFCH